MQATRWPQSLGSAWLVAGALALAVLPACSKESKSQEPKGGDTAKVAAKGQDVATPVAVEGAARPQSEGKSAMGDRSYELSLDVPASVAKGSQGVVRVTVTPKTGWKMNKEFPTRLKVTSPEGVSVTKDQMSIADAERFEDKGATFAVAFTPDSAGKKSFQADFKFAVCTDTTCDPKKQELAWVVDVQ